jgi:predicted small secreted protein
MIVTMKWKIYFVFITLITGLTLNDYLSNLNNWTFYDVLTLINTIISEIGVFAFAFNKNYFSVRFWKYVFWTVVGLEGSYVLYLITPLKEFELMQLIFQSGIYPMNESSPTDPLFYVIISIILLLLIPGYYILYRLGHPKGKSSLHKK